jgi:acetone carboxylase gamma subunit
MKNNMSNVDETEDYEVGYGKPPKDGQFKKGVSGNPSGRLKKPVDFDSALMRALDARVKITENGKAKVVTKRDLAATRLANDAASGKLQAIRVVRDTSRGVQERAAELEKNTPSKRDYENLEAKDLTDVELLLMSHGFDPNLLK